jgi:hypothetical protein
MLRVSPLSPSLFNVEMDVPLKKLNTSL